MLHCISHINSRISGSPWQKRQEVTSRVEVHNQVEITTILKRIMKLRYPWTCCFGHYITLFLIERYLCVINFITQNILRENIGKWVTVSKAWIPVIKFGTTLILPYNVHSYNISSGIVWAKTWLIYLTQLQNIIVKQSRNNMATDKEVSVYCMWYSDTVNSSQQGWKHKRKFALFIVQTI